MESIKKLPILVVAEQELLGFYSSLLTDNEKVETCPLEEPALFCSDDAYDLMFLDCGNDTEAGLTFLRTMKHARPGLPVIFVTASSSEEMVLQAFKAGAREYFKKPVNAAELLESVATILSLKRKTTEKRIPLTMMKNGGESEINTLNGELPERILRAIHFIETNLTSNLTLDMIASVACLSKYHFSRKFKQHVGISPIQFIINLRIYQASILLRCTDLPIAAVSKKAGFSELSKFFLQFKKINGISPTDFRKTSNPH